MVKDYRFIGIAPEVDLKERGSALLNKRTEPFTFDEMRGYKVFTALLTQSGGDDPQLIYSGELTVGVTYYINGGGGWDFTNVGAPNNNDGTPFVATGTTPNSWGTADPSNGLSYNTGAPVATVLENTIGNIWFTYNGVGIYSINSNDLFTSNKTYIDTKNIFGGGGSQNIFEDMEESSINNLRFINYYGLQSVPTAFDGIDMGRIEIRVYN